MAEDNITFSLQVLTTLCQKPPPTALLWKALHMQKGRGRLSLCQPGDPAALEHVIRQAGSKASCEHGTQKRQSSILPVWICSYGGNRILGERPPAAEASQLLTDPIEIFGLHLTQLQVHYWFIHNLKPISFSKCFVLPC